MANTSPKVSSHFEMTPTTNRLSWDSERTRPRVQFHASSREIVRRMSSPGSVIELASDLLGRSSARTPKIARGTRALLLARLQDDLDLAGCFTGGVQAIG
jgi:hypothetical protein